MNRKLLLFTILFICQNLINSAYDDCSAFTCSKLAPEPGLKCDLIQNQCQSHYEDCSTIDNENTCNSNLLKDLKLKCSWDASKTPKCQTIPRICSEYSSLMAYGVTCNSLAASATNKKCILVGGSCVEEEGCTGDNTSCSTHKPLLTTGDWDHLNKCEIDSEESCSPAEKTCSDYILNDDDEYCESFKASDPNKKKCFLIDGASKQCVDQYITCEAYNAETTKSQTGCEAVSPYINDKHSKCHYDEENMCSTIKKACEDITDPITCVEHTLDNNKKRCVYKGLVTGCIEQFKTCALYNEHETSKNKDGCEAIEEDLTHKCVYTTTTEGGVSTSTCENKSKYQPCTTYTGKDRKECESIIPSENMRCIFKDDSQCVSAPLECEQYTGNDEYECVNNYKPLDENYKCVFRGSCIKVLKFEYEYCYLGNSDNCATIQPKNKGENYSIKCSYDSDSQKCIRIEKSCSDGNGNDAALCASIILKDSKKKCILIGTTCTEEYKTCNDYNSDTSITTINSGICTGITSIDGKKCQYEEPDEVGGRGTCSGIAKPCGEFDSTKFQIACVSIPLNDITKKCVYESGDCKLETKSCSELVFNGNESGIEEKCKSAKVSDENNVCILSSDKKYCIEVDKSKTPKDTTSPTTKPNSGSDNSGTNANSGTNTNSGTNNGQGNDNNSGKEIYLDKLLIIILCLLF